MKYLAGDIANVLNNFLSLNGLCIKCHSEERSDEESRGGAGHYTHEPHHSEILRFAQDDRETVLLVQGPLVGRGIRACPVLDTGGG